MRDLKMEPKLISYITSKYQTKSDMMYDKTLWAEIIEPMLPRFKEAGAARQTLAGRLPVIGVTADTP